MNFLLIIIIGATCGIILQQLTKNPFPDNYTYLGNSREAYNNAEKREAVSESKMVWFIAISIIIGFFAFNIGSYKKSESNDVPISLEEKTERLNVELRQNSKNSRLLEPIQELPIQKNEPIIQKPKVRLNSAGKEVDKNGYLE